MSETFDEDELSLLLQSIDDSITLSLMNIANTDSKALTEIRYQQLNKYRLLLNKLSFIQRENYMIYLGLGSLPPA